MNNIQIHNLDLEKILLLEYKINSMPLRCLLDHFNNNICEIINYLEQNYDFIISEKDINYIETQIKYIKSRNIHIIPFFHENYPNRLKYLLDSPLVIFCLGNTKLLKNPLISIVGSREPTNNTIDFTKQTANTLKNNGFTIVSGMANGVDQIAHENSLPQTIGIIPYGFNKLTDNSTILPILMEKNALIISQFCFTKVVEKWHFLHRNSLIAAIAPTTCIMQCNIKSGTMDTAKKAIYYNNSLAVVTAHPYDQKFSGNINLLSQNTKCTPLINPDFIPYANNIKDTTFHFSLDNSNIIDKHEINNKNILELLTNNKNNQNIILNTVIHNLLLNNITINNHNIELI